MYHTVKIFYDEDGEQYRNTKWCFAIKNGDGSGSTLCSGEFYGDDLHQYKEKENGKVTCSQCKKIIRKILEVKFG